MPELVQRKFLDAPDYFNLAQKSRELETGTGC